MIYYLPILKLNLISIRISSHLYLVKSEMLNTQYWPELTFEQYMFLNILLQKCTFWKLLSRKWLFWAIMVLGMAKQHLRGLNSSFDRIRGLNSSFDRIGLRKHQFIHCYSTYDVADFLKIVTITHWWSEMIFKSRNVIIM